MKKLLLIVALANIALATQAQKFGRIKDDYNEAILVALQSHDATEFDGVKKDIDKIMTAPKTSAKAQASAEGWMWKCMIYAKMSQGDKGIPTFLDTAEAAFMHYVALDPTYALLVQNQGIEVPIIIYQNYYNNGIKSFNTKNWDSAAYYFSGAVYYGDIIFSNKWTADTNRAFDTTSILYCGYAYQNAKKTDSAITQYLRLINANAGGKDLKDIYKYVLIYFIDKKNQQNFNKYLAITKKVYPKDTWVDFEQEYINKNFSFQQKVAMYDEGDASGKLTAEDYLRFGDMLANLSKDDKDKLDSATQIAYTIKASEAFQKVVAKDPTNGIAAFNAGIIYYKMYIDYDDTYRTNLGKLQKLNIARAAEKNLKNKAATLAQYKADTATIKQANIAIDKQITDVLTIADLWFEKSYNILKDKATHSTTIEVTLRKKVVDYLANIYEYKRNKQRGINAKLYDEYDAKFNMYDALHE